MQDGTAPLHPAIVSPSDDGTIYHQNCADGNSTFSPPLSGFIYSSLHEFVHGTITHYIPGIWE
jgi:hypothetical protein